MKDGASELLHQHRFVVRNPYQPESDRCDCGVHRYELMGPFERRAARLRAYRQMGPAFAERSQ